eukprot:378343-Hanusia_phi.AAC.1
MNNTISVTLASSTALMAGTSVTLHGLMYGAGPLHVTLTDVTGNDCYGTATSVFKPTALYQNEMLVIDVEANTVPGKKYAFDFTLLNPTCGQPMSTVWVDSTCTPRMDLIATEGSEPNYVRHPEFNVSYIWQENPLPSVTNRIRVNFSANVDIPSGVYLNISGLRHTNTAQSSLNLGPSSEFEVHSWSNGNLVIKTKNTLAHSMYHDLYFNVMNPDCCQNPTDVIRLSTDYACFAPVDLVQRQSSSLLINIKGGSDIESKP